MSFAMRDAILPVADDVRDVLGEEWRRLAAPGTWLAGEERVAVAAEARAARARAAGATGLAPAMVEVAHAVAASPGEITAAWVDDVVAAGPDVVTYVEVVGIVARLAAVDACVRGVGATEEPLPEPVPGEPSRERNPAARQRRAFVPTDGGDGPPTMLSAVPAEARAQMQLHGALYLTEQEMGDLARGTELPRPQMELVAARVSYLNHCIF